MFLCDGNEILTLNMRHDTSSYSTQPHQESINMIDVYNVSHEEILKDLFATNHQSGNPTFSSHTDLTSPEVINPSSGNPTPISEPETNDSFPPGNSNPSSPLPPFHNSLSGSTTSSSPSLLISETSDYFLEEFANELALITFPPGNDDLPFDAKSDLRENHFTKMFTDEHALDYSSPPLWDDYDDELFDLETVNDNAYEDQFDSKEEKIKDSKILIDELDLPGSITNLATTEKNVKKTTYASLILEDSYPPLSLYELPFHKEVPGLGALLSFSSENEEKVFNPGILISKRVHTSLLPELSHRGPKAFKVIKIFESPMEIFPCSYGEDIRILDVPCLHFYPP
ncbi:hypothetical protein Tco_0840241 [Tanacetum coccineum]|uniref:Reverse transcriptase domain-containing protein n=1 Tax=Tanacetum coccineum TaxID=301880 RepID=A0ABQ5AUV7_9ASTR